MKIKELDIISFGKLENSNIVLQDGLNVIYGKNESGKSTIALFIESMLFGFGSSKSQRQKCIPWGKESASGSMTVEEKGEFLTVFRRAGKSAKSDLTVYSPENSDISAFMPQSRETYRKTVYCRENDAAFFGSTEEIDRKLTNLISSGDETANASSAVEILEKKRRALKAFRGNSGKLYEIEQKLSLLRAEYNNSISSDATVKENIQKINSLTEEYNREYSHYLNLVKKDEPDAQISSLDEEISRQKAYIDSFPDFNGEYPMPSHFLSKSLAISIICTLVLFIIGYLFYTPLMLLSFLPVLIFSLSFFFKEISAKKFRKEFLKAQNCSDYEEYQRLISDKKEAIKYYEQLLVKKSLHMESATQKELHIKEELDNSTKKLLSLKEQIASFEKTNASVNIRPVDEILSEISYFSEQKADTIKKVDALDAAIYALKKAKDKISKDFTPEINERAKKYIEMIAPKEGRNVLVKSDLSLFMTDPFPQDISECSQGFKEEVYLCFRLALSEILFPKSFPIILDNPFAASDDYREKSLIDLLYSISKTRQVIIFTNRKNSYFEYLDCNYIDISPKGSV
ncbi:MAG: ATP-binding protein [Clostridia bacterium]